LPRICRWLAGVILTSPLASAVELAADIAPRIVNKNVFAGMFESLERIGHVMARGCGLALVAHEMLSYR
jgi:hypothetical protein